MPSYFTVFMQCCAPECVRSSAYTLMLIPIRYHYVKTVAEFGIGTMVHTLLILAPPPTRVWPGTGGPVLPEERPRVCVSEDMPFY